METEGTYILSGIIQGPVPPGPDGREQLAHFNEKLMKSGVALSLRVDGASFSLLASDHVVATDAVTEAEIEGLVEAGLNSLLEIYPEPMRLSVMSTIRSRVFLSGREHQAVYVVSFPGVIKVETATIKAQLLPRARRLSFRFKALFTLAALALIGLAFWASTRWIDYAPARRQIALMFKGNKLEEIRLNAAALRDVVAIEKTDISALRKVIQLKVSRGPGWGRKADPGDPDSVRLNAALFERRYLKVSYFDVSGNVVIDRDGKVFERALPISGLKDAEVLNVEIPIPDGLPLAEIVVSP